MPDTEMLALVRRCFYGQSKITTCISTVLSSRRHDRTPSSIKKRRVYSPLVLTVTLRGFDNDDFEVCCVFEYLVDLFFG